MRAVNKNLSKVRRSDVRRPALSYHYLDIYRLGQEFP